ncbi:hypothetical protein EXS73_00110 [Candidatus Pacearchaeota archaeon]|nr:hypothetical protein [Candidatus Pacearchaeota archaeon]
MKYTLLYDGERWDAYTPGSLSEMRTRDLPAHYSREYNVTSDHQRRMFAACIEQAALNNQKSIRQPTPETTDTFFLPL